MCLGIPGRIVEIVDAETRIACVEVSGVRRNVNISMVEAGPGDWVLIHVGFALSVIDEAQAQETLGYLAQIGEAYQQEFGWQPERSEGETSREAGDKNKVRSASPPLSDLESFSRARDVDHAERP